MGDQIELKEIECRALADVAGDTHLLFIHDLRVLFKFLCIVFHREAPFILRSERVLRMMQSEMFFLADFLANVQEKWPFLQEHGLI